MSLKARQCVAMAAIGSLTLSSGQACWAAEATTSFKLGVFQTASREFLGLVLQDNRVLEIAAANAAFEKRTAKAARIKIPADMNELIARYDSDIGPRLRQIAAANTAAGTAPYSHELTSVRILPPLHPAVILNAGANYPEHAQGIVEQAARVAAQAG
jgi:hypothetical protein